jgi:hypothetical protein
VTISVLGYLNRMSSATFLDEVCYWSDQHEHCLHLLVHIIYNLLLHHSHLTCSMNSVTQLSQAAATLGQWLTDDNTPSAASRHCQHIWGAKAAHAHEHKAPSWQAISIPANYCIGHRNCQEAGACIVHAATTAHKPSLATARWQRAAPNRCASCKQCRHV